jgi:GntR family transcriptional regulator/MocR family aminotransferase
MLAFEQLLAEGYVEGRVGSGTYVSPALPDDLLHSEPSAAIHRSSPEGDLRLSRRGKALLSTSAPAFLYKPTTRPFHTDPALDTFPMEVWSRLAARPRPRSLLAYFGDRAGYGPLRVAIADYLTLARGVRCEAAQVIVVNGVHQGLELATRVLLDPGDYVWIEDPGYMCARGVFLAADAKVVPVALDDEGVSLPSKPAKRATPRLIFVTPSHQHPLGMTMSAARRLALLKCAGEMGAAILEDDYDSEYRYSGRPLAALQGLDNEGRVIYLGSFSKTLFPSLRIGYLVVPPALVDTFLAAHSLLNGNQRFLEQAVLADFIREGHMARHIRRMRKLYAERRESLVDAASEHLEGLLDLQGNEAGMHVVGRLPRGIDDMHLARDLAQQELATLPLSMYSMARLDRVGLLLGFAAHRPASIRPGIRQLASSLEQWMAKHKPARAAEE